jgi:hypothetical protein
VIKINIRKTTFHPSLPGGTDCERLLRAMEREPETHDRRWPEPILPPETEPLPAALRRTTPFPEPEQPNNWWLLIVLGIVVLFGLVVGGGYYWFSNPGRTPMAVEMAPPPNAAAKAAPAAAEAPAAPLPPQLALGLRPMASQPNGSDTAPEPAPSQSPTLSAALRPIVARPPPPASSAPLVFSVNRQLWDEGPDILALQQFLNAHGFTVATTGPGSPGNETSVFGMKTYQALVKFQAASDLPPTGDLGPLTRAALDRY